MTAQPRLVHREGILFGTVFTQIIGGSRLDWRNLLLESLPLFLERVRPSILPYRLHWTAWLSHIGIKSALLLQALFLCIILGHDDNFGPLPHARHLRCDILLTI